MQSPLLGFNNNVKHKGKVFHLQTEDSGIKHPHVITHLFADGGRILKTVKTSYAEHVGSERLTDIVRELMKEQHKAMFIALRDGQFDALISGTSPGGKSAADMSVLPKLSVPAVQASAPPPPQASRAPENRPQGRQQAPELFMAPLDRASPDVSPLESPPLSEDTSSFRPPGDLPPPPATVLGKKPDGGYRSVSPSDRARPPPRENASPGSGRYAASRPATIFANARPEAGSIFGEELISEKSLDEVILSYLAEDLDASGTPSKK